MSAEYIIVMVLLTTTTAEEIVPINIFNTKGNNETVTEISVENEKKESNDGKEDLSKTMNLVLFRPYIPEIEDFGTEIATINIHNNLARVKVNSSEVTTSDGDTTTAKHLDDHINKRNTDEKYTKDVKYPLKGDYSARVDVTSQPYARYEITEDVIDVPDDRTPAGPVIHNYSPYRNTLLNLGSPKNDTEVKNETADEDSIHSKSRLSILHIKAEVDEKPDGKFKHFFKGVKSYLSGIKSGVVDGLNKLFKHDKVPHGKDFEGSDEGGDDNSFDGSDGEDESDDDDDDFAELHQTIRKGFRFH